MKRKCQLLVGLAIVMVPLVSVLAAAIYFLSFNELVGGMPPSYSAVDYDARPTDEAKTAVPIAIALKKYFAANNAYPKNLSFLQGASPTTSPSMPGGGMNGWTYLPDAGGAGFELYKRLGKDPSLQYAWDGTTESWVFDPGDGSPRKKILLKP